MFIIFKHTSHVLKTFLILVSSMVNTDWHKPYGKNLIGSSVIWGHKVQNKKYEKLLTSQSTRNSLHVSVLYTCWDHKMYLRDKSVLSHQKADTTLGLIQSIVICFKGKEDWAYYPSTLGPEVGWQLQVCYNIRFQTTQTVMRPWLKTLRRKEELNSRICFRSDGRPRLEEQMGEGVLIQRRNHHLLRAAALEHVLNLMSCWRCPFCSTRRRGTYLWTEVQGSLELVSSRPTWTRVRLKTETLFCSRCCDWCTGDWPNALCWIAHYCCLWVEAEPLGLL